MRVAFPLIDDDLLSPVPARAAEAIDYAEKNARSHINWRGLIQRQGMLIAKITELFAFKLGNGEMLACDGKRLLY